MVDERFWDIINEMEMICLPTLLCATEPGYSTLTQNCNTSQRNDVIQFYKNQIILSNLRTLVEQWRLPFFGT